MKRLSMKFLDIQEQLITLHHLERIFKLYWNNFYIISNLQYLVAPTKWLTEQNWIITTIWVNNKESAVSVFKKLRLITQITSTST